VVQTKKHTNHFQSNENHSSDKVDFHATFAMTYKTKNIFK